MFFLITFMIFYIYLVHIFPCLLGADSGRSSAGSWRAPAHFTFQLRLMQLSCVSSATFPHFRKQVLICFHIWFQYLPVAVPLVALFLIAGSRGAVYVHLYMFFIFGKNLRDVYVFADFNIWSMFLYIFHEPQLVSVQRA